MPTSKTFFTGGLVLAYLLIGSGHYVAQATKHDARREAKDFADTLPRKVYRYSVVPGGVTSPEELAQARRTDPVVAAHFADFGKNTRITTLQEDMYVYVSYRQGNKIYYSKKRHKVCKGEVVITDGKNFARARCANRLSRVFRPPALVFDEPKAPDFDYVDPPSEPTVDTSTPLISSGYGPEQQYSQYPAPQTPPGGTGANPGPPSPVDPYASGGAPILPALGPFAAGAPGFLLPPNNPVTPPVTSVPEPNEWPFLIGGFAMLAALATKKLRKQ